jgi:hypothetical protein
VKAKFGAPGAITATARKLARVLQAMINHRQPFDRSSLGNAPLRQARQENALCRAAKELGYVLQPIQAEAVSWQSFTCHLLMKRRYFLHF